MITPNESPLDNLNAQIEKAQKLAEDLMRILSGTYPCEQGVYSPAPTPEPAPKSPHSIAVADTDTSFDTYLIIQHSKTCDSLNGWASSVASDPANRGQLLNHLYRMHSDMKSTLWSKDSQTVSSSRYVSNKIEALITKVSGIA